MKKNDGHQDQVDAIRDRIMAEVAAKGVSIMHVFGSHEGSKPYSYTIGESLKGRPEIILSRIAPRTAQMVLETCHDEMERGWRPTPGIHEKIFSMPVLVVASQDWVKSERTGLVTSVAGADEDYTLLQLILPDASGLFPDDRGCDPAYADIERFDQPLANSGKLH